MTPSGPTSADVTPSGPTSADMRTVSNLSDWKLQQGPKQAVALRHGGKDNLETSWSYSKGSSSSADVTPSGPTNADMGTVSNLSDWKLQQGPKRSRGTGHGGKGTTARSLPEYWSITDIEASTIPKQAVALRHGGKGNCKKPP